MTRRILSFAAVRLGAVSSALLLAACVSHVQLAPDAPGWQLAGSEATWRADAVVIVARLDTDAGAVPGRGLVANTGTAPVRVTFVPDTPGRTGDAQGLPDAVVAGVPCEIPAAFDLGAGTFDFALRSDELWTGAPPAGAPISWTIVVTTPAGESRCPFRFRVASTSRSLSPEAEFAIGTVLTVATFVALGYVYF